MDDQDKAVISALSVNSLAALNPDVQALAEDRDRLLAEQKEWQENRSALKAENKSLKSEVRVFKKNRAQAENGVRTTLIADITSVTGEDPADYSKVPTANLRMTHNAIVATAKQLGVNMDGPADGEVDVEAGKKERQDDEEHLMDGLGENEDELEIEIESEDDDEDEDDLDLASNEDEDEDDEYAEDGGEEIGATDLEHSKKSSGGYTEYGDPRTDQGPTPNKKADRTLLVNRITGGLEAAKATKKSRSAAKNTQRKKSDNASADLYGRIFASNREELEKVN